MNPGPIFSTISYVPRKNHTRPSIPLSYLNIKVCDHECTVIFNNTEFHITHNNDIILKVPCNFSKVLWILTLIHTGTMYVDKQLKTVHIMHATFTQLRISSSAYKPPV